MLSFVKFLFDLLTEIYRKEQLTMDTMIQAPTSFKLKLVAEISCLQKFARNFTTGLDDTNDLVQDTILKAITCFDNFQNGTNFKAWLYVLMRNIYINNYRRLKFYRNYTQVATVNQMAFSTKSNHENDGESNFSSKAIKMAIAQLQPTISYPFELYVTGYRYQEIASKLGVPIGTIKTRIHVARKKLKIMLNEYDVSV